jgi:hypothetical protein
MLPVRYPRQEFPLGGPIAVQRVEDDHAWDLLTPVQEYAEECLGGNVIASALREDLQHTAVLIHRPSPIMGSALNREQSFVDMPCVTWSGAPALLRIRWPTRGTMGGSPRTPR